MTNTVKAWEEDVVLPTYGTGRPDRNPMFFEKRVYQGSSGVVYPYPVVEKVEDECHERTYRAVFLENEYLKVMILPELGGRVQMAYDKLKQRHFVYYNHVVKPALVGLTGPWISGGIEFNWPQHHRPSTFLPVDYTIERRPDGSAVVWVSERERMFHLKGMAGFTLRPGRAVLEIQGVLYNPTPLPQTFLWWANPAVAVGPDYQSVFPGDVHAVFDHGKRDVSRYPIATGTYYKTDYSAGVDISRYRNIPVPTSFMAVSSRYDFVGGYEHDTQAGLLHVADHHVSPGKKQWTWGHGDFGQAWDRNLTDADGPYIELMTGVFTDNQPDFTWLQPYEEKTFTQYFMPYRELGVVKNASADLLMNIEPDGHGASTLKVMATSRQRGVRLSVTDAAGHSLVDTTADLTPETVLALPVAAATTDGLSVTLSGPDGRCLLSWTPEPDEVYTVPDPAEPAPDPADVATTEQLYLTGLHLEQYRHATYSPVDYYHEALRRDPSDARSNNAMGLWLVRKGQFAAAEPYLRRAIRTLTQRNPNPYDGEPYYNLGLALKFQGRADEAADAFHKACWNAAWQAPGFHALAQLAAARGDWDEALRMVEKSLVRGWHDLSARHLKTTVLRHLGRADEARAWALDSVALDAFNFGCRFELGLLDGEGLDDLARLMRRDAHNYAELLLDYADAGCWTEAVRVADWALSLPVADGTMILYYKAWAQSCMGLTAEAADTVRQAEARQPDTYFPNALQAIAALQEAERLVPTAARAPYLLGNLWYDKRQYAEAVDAWERAARADEAFPTTWRNLALAYFNKLHRPDDARRALERAYALDPTDARVLMELDQLYKRLNVAHAERLALLDAHRDTAFERDDLYLEYATLLNQLGRYDEALRMIDARRFHPWEGGEGKVPEQYQQARRGLARQALAEGRPEEGLRWVDECFVYPHNLGEGKLPAAQENDFHYMRGLLLERCGRTDEAADSFARGSAGDCQPAAAVYYNDQKPHKLFYQGLSLRKLGREAEARGCFHRLVDFGEQHLHDVFHMDYFAVSLPDLQIWEDDMDKKNRIHCLYLMGLGHMGLGNLERARGYLLEAHRLDLNHQGVEVHLALVGQQLNQ